MLSFKKILFLIFILLSSALYSTIHNVPYNWPTIQAGIDVAIDADTVLVQPGTYYENIDYNGKSITIGSLFLTTQDSDYIASTIIDGSNSGRVVTFENGEDETTVLCGFTITNGIASGNWPMSAGGGIGCYADSNPSLENLIIIGNSAEYGGGIYFAVFNSILENVIISGNSANYGGGVFFETSNTILENVTITGNTAISDGGGICCWADSNPSLVNCIFWNDSPEEISFWGSGDQNSITISYSDIEGGEAGIVTNGNGTVNWLAGNIDVDPLFVSPPNGDYHLQSNSPCIDAGDPGSPLDPDGTIADMGGLFFNQAPVADFTADATYGLPPLTVNFTDLSTQGIGAVDEWYWDFGDGNNSSQQNPTNEYQDLGNYTVSLTVTNIYDFTDTITKVNYITVSAEVYNGPVWHISTTGSDEWGNGTEELPFATIQHGIDVSANADTVLVQPGTYVENVYFDGDLITVGSLFLTTGDEDYIATTIIDGGNNGSVVSFGNVNSSTVLSGFTITNGTGANYGGGIYIWESNPSLDNLIITGNSAIYNGGGIYCNDSNTSLESVTISGNTAEFGGGILCQTSDPNFENVTISDNIADIGGGIYCFQSSPTLENVTISGNNASDDGGGIFCSDNSNPSLVNCIIWDDSPQEIYFYDDLEPNSITIAYSDIEGGEAGIVTNSNGTVNWLDGNMDVDPLFVDAGNGNYNLTEDSPCIDAGDPSSPLDPDGTTADMGAWFYNQGNAIEDNEIENVKFNLSNYPNPFNPLTTIKFDIKENEIGVLSIFNIRGQLLESHRFEAGKHNFQWDASDMSSGVYLYQLQTENTIANKKMLLLK